jgi:hypothetical protein
MTVTPFASFLYPATSPALFTMGTGSPESDPIRTHRGVGYSYEPEQA